jgi:hypothetical protein
MSDTEAPPGGHKPEIALHYARHLRTEILACNERSKIGRTGGPGRIRGAGAARAGAALALRRTVSPKAGASFRVIFVAACLQRRQRGAPWLSWGTGRGGPSPNGQRKARHTGRAESRKIFVIESLTSKHAANPGVTRIRPVRLRSRNDRSRIAYQMAAAHLTPSRRRQRGLGCSESRRLVKRLGPSLTMACAGVLSLRSHGE